jgi:hypothetical protein
VKTKDRDERLRVREESPKRGFGDEESGKRNPRRREAHAPGIRSGNHTAE